MIVSKCFWWRGENHVGAFCRGDVWELLWISAVARFSARTRVSLFLDFLSQITLADFRPKVWCSWKEPCYTLLVKDERWCCAGWLPWRLTIWQEGERLPWVPCYRVDHFLAPRLPPCFWGLVPDYGLQQEICAFTSVLLATSDRRGFVWVSRIPLTSKRFVGFGLWVFFFFW